METPMYIGHTAVVPAQPKGRREHWTLALSVAEPGPNLSFAINGTAFVVHEDALAALLRERAFMQARLQEARDGAE